ncbi:hypothetical protein MC885_000325, partial [Smutsia gigantea]
KHLAALGRPIGSKLRTKTWQEVGLQFKLHFTLRGPRDFPMKTFALWSLVKESLESSPAASHLPGKPLEENIVAEQLKQTVTGYEALVKPTASGSDESLPPEYEQKLTQKKQYFQKASGSSVRQESTGLSHGTEDRPQGSFGLVPLLANSVISVPFFPEEEEEQVPTDGGTSAEAMQVPLEEDDELEEEEIINDENFLGKRPLDSPEAEEMPSMKRPRLPSAKGDAPDVVLEAREPLSSINAQKVPPMLSPVHAQDSEGLPPPSPEPPMLAPVAKAQMPTAKPLETKTFTPKTKTKTSSPGQRTKSPKTTQSPAMVGSPIRSPKAISKEKKSPGRSKSPKSPKSPKALAHIPAAPGRPETPSRPPSATASEKTSKETIQTKQIQTPPDVGKLNHENQQKKAVVTDKTIDDSIDAVIARACAEREPDPFEFSSGSESEGDIFTSPKRISVPECTIPKASASSNNFTKSGSTPLPLSGGTSSSDNSWTMDASIDEVVRKAKMGTPPGMPPGFPYISSPSVSPPTPEPLHKVYEEKTRLPPSMDIKKKLKKELKTKMKKKEKQRDKERERDKSKEKSKEKDKVKERDKEKETGRETKHPWKEFLKDEESDPYKFKIKEFEEVDPRVRLKDGIVRREKEKHKDKKKDREKGKKDKDKRDKGKDRGREEKPKNVLGPLGPPPKDAALPLFSPTAAARVPALLPALSPVLPEKLFDEKEKPKEKDRKKDKKEKKKKKEKEKEKEKKEKEREKEKREREKREKEKEKHRHEKIKVEPVVPAPSPVIPRLTLRVGAGQDKISAGAKAVQAAGADVVPSTRGRAAPHPLPAPITIAAEGRSLSEGERAEPL